MTTERSSSEGFPKLAPGVQRWIYQQNWQALRDIQEQAIEPVLAGRDVVISSATASGKTEAAFLPLFSRPPSDSGGLRVLGISPLKALINDQASRLSSLGETAGFTVTPWHGDVAATTKRRFVDRPGGALLITPESLEAMFVTRGNGAAHIFSGLDYVVIDELHSFIGTERGRQLQTLLHRLELLLGRPVPRIGLSATLGDLRLACEFLRAESTEPPTCITSTTQTHGLRLQIRGYRRPKQSPGSEEPAADDVAIADDLYDVLKGGRHIAFANSRANVETFVRLLNDLCDRAGTPNYFWAHHGNLSKEIREDAEAELRSSRAATVIATSTLELGIDVGSVESIAQIGVPPSVAALRQRLGRSGRSRGADSVVRAYLTEDDLGDSAAPQEQLRDQVAQAVAMVLLLVRKWNESPRDGALHLSTLVQQVLSVAAQRGGFRAEGAWRALCATGPFRAVDSETFARLLRDLGRHGLLSQTHDGLVVLGREGEHLVNHYDFYSAFMSADEYRLVHGARTLGTLPVTRPVVVDDCLLFAGQRWRVREVRDAEKLIDLVPAPGGRAPTFSGGGALVSDKVRGVMLSVLQSDEVFPFLDPVARDLLDEGRAAFARFDLTTASVVSWGDDVVLFPWVGDCVMDTLSLMLKAEGFSASRDGVGILVTKSDEAEVLAAIRRLASLPPTERDLVALVENKQKEKHHIYLSDELLALDYAAGYLDVRGAVSVLQALALTP